MRRSTSLTAIVAMLASLLLLGAAPPQHANSQFTRVIVTFDEDVLPAPAAAALESRFRGDVAFVYEHVLNGAAIDVPARSVDALSNTPGVRRVEPDGIVTTMGELATQTEATWGLDRIDQRDPSLDGTYTYTADGTGVTAYVIDTGIRATHDDFQLGESSRVAPGFDAIDGGTGMTDCNGHGTHVASTLGGKTYGVAKDVTLVPVRVLDCRGSGSWSGVIAGVDWVASQQSLAVEGGIGPHAAVANMSLGGPATSDTSVDDAVRALIVAGVTTVVAAGNDGEDAGGFSPARVETAITVGATDVNDAVASFSNQGHLVDIFAPGVDIEAAYSGRQKFYTDSTVATLSGTSMAAPHVAGVAAMVLEDAPSASPDGVTQHILDNASRGDAGSLLSGLEGSSADRLLYSLLEALGDDQPSEDPATDVAISFSTPKDADDLEATPTTVTVALTETGGLSVDEPFTVSLVVAPSEGSAVVAATGTVQSLATGTSETLDLDWDASRLEAGPYELTASHDVPGDPTNSATITVNILAAEPEPGGEPTASVDLRMVTSGPWFRPQADFAVTDADGGPLADVIVVAAVSGSADGEISCTTGTDGTCTTEVLRTKESPGSLTLTPKSVAGSTREGDSASISW